MYWRICGVRNTNAYISVCGGNQKLGRPAFIKRFERRPIPVGRCRISGYGVFVLDDVLPKFPIDADTARLDWLASTEQNIGQVLLPRECVENNLIDGLRGAIDCAMKLDA